MPGAMSLSERLSTERTRSPSSGPSSRPPMREPPMIGPPAKTGSSSNSGSLPDVLLQLGADVRARLVSSRGSAGGPEIADLEARVKACLDSHGQRLAALELAVQQATWAIEGTAPRSRSPGPAPLADRPAPANVPLGQAGEGLRAELRSDMTRHLEVLRTEVERELVDGFTSRIDALRHEVDRRLGEMTIALESLSQSRPSGTMSTMVLPPPAASEMEKAAWSEGWRAGQLKALEAGATSPEFGPKAQLSSSRISEASSHPLMSAIEPSPNKGVGRRSLLPGDPHDREDSARSRDTRDKHWL